MSCHGVMYIAKEKYKTRRKPGCGRLWSTGKELVTMKEICKRAGSSEYTARKHIVLANKSPEEFIEFWKKRVK